MENLDLKEYLRKKYEGKLIDHKIALEKPSYLEDVIARAIPRIHPMNRPRTLAPLYQALENQEKVRNINQEHFEIRELDRVPDNEEIIRETVGYFQDIGYKESFREGNNLTLKNDLGSVLYLKVDSGSKYFSVIVQSV